MSFPAKSSLNFNELGLTYDRRHARHIACPQRLKYIHNITDGYFPYVDDSFIESQNQTLDNSGLKTKNLGLYNTDIDWQNELMSLAQRVRSTLDSQDESQRSRSRLSRFQSNRERNHVRSFSNQASDENKVTKKLFNRRKSLYGRKKSARELSEIPEISEQQEQQDHGIWLLPILCHILHVETIPEAQQWLTNANGTEKRLAMELISRTMQDMQQSEGELDSEWTVSEPFFSPTKSGRVPLPYKYWYAQPKSQITPPISSEIDQIFDKCERATSPMRLITPAKRVSTTARPFSTFHESSISRASTNRNLPSAFSRRQSSRMDKIDMARPPTILETSLTPNNDSIDSRQSIRMKNFKIPFNNDHDRPFTRGRQSRVSLV